MPKKKREVLRVRYNPPMFLEYVAPKGFLNIDPACHGLFYYYIKASTTKKLKEDELLYEGDKPLVVNYEQMFRSTAMTYGVTPEQMLNYWPAVDMQARLLHLAELPEWLKFRGITTIKSN